MASIQSHCVKKHRNDERISFCK